MCHRQGGKKNGSLEGWTEWSGAEKAANLLANVFQPIGLVLQSSDQV